MAPTRSIALASVAVAAMGAIATAHYLHGPRSPAAPVDFNPAVKAARVASFEPKILALPRDSRKSFNVFHASS